MRHGAWKVRQDRFSGLYTVIRDLEDGTVEETVFTYTLHKKAAEQAGRMNRNDRWATKVTKTVI